MYYDYDWLTVFVVRKISLKVIPVISSATVVVIIVVV